MQGGLKNIFQQSSLPGTAVTSTTSTTSSSSTSLPMINFGGSLQPSLSLPKQLGLTQSTVAQQPAQQNGLVFTNTTASSSASAANTVTTALTGFSFSFSGANQAASLPGLLQNPLASSASTAAGGSLFQASQPTTTAQTSDMAVSMATNNAPGGLTFNFGGGGLKLPSGPTTQQQQQQQQTTPIFGGGSQQTGSLTIGGQLGSSGSLFGGTPALSTASTPSKLSFGLPKPQAPVAPNQQLSSGTGGIFGGGLQTNASKPALPTFNFGSNDQPQSCQSQMQPAPFSFTGGMASGQQPQSQTGTGLQLGSTGQGSSGGLFNFSAGASGSAGSGAGGSGFNFGAAVQGSSSGFNFSGASNPPGSLSFGQGTTNSLNQAGLGGGGGLGFTGQNQSTGIGSLGGFPSSSGTGMGQVQQATPGGTMFGQPALQQPTGSSNLFAPSLTNPSLGTPQQEPKVGFNFTPTPSSTFNFTGNLGTPTNSGTLFTAGTPQSETARPMASARRRRGRKK